MKKITLLLLLMTITFNSYAQFPEGFETAVPPTGWTSFIGTNGEGTGQNWTTSATAASGSQAAYVRYESATTLAEDWLVTPQFTPSSSANILTFQQRQSYTTDYGNTYTVRVSTVSQTAHADFTIIDTQSETDFTAGVYSVKNIDLSAYDGTPIYVAFVMANNDGDNWYIDDVDLIANAMAPNCVTNLSPVQDATSVNNNGRQVILSWDAPSVDNNHDAHTSYEIMFGTTSGDLTSLGSLAPTATSVTITNVDYDTTYYWMVVPSNVGGGASGCSEYSFTTAASAQLPYSNSFISFPSDWTEASGDYGIPSGTTGGFTDGDFVNDTSHENGKSAYINIYGSFTDEYLISPVFDLSGGTYYLNYDIGLTTFAGTSSATLGADDYLALLVTQDGGSSWQELSRWDASTDISNEGQSATEITLSSYGAEVQFAFYANSGASETGIDNDLFIDNFQITSETLGTSTNTLEGFTLYPTIVKEELNFRSQNKVEAITVFNLLGQKVFSGAPNTNNSSINLSNLRPGVYVVKVSAEGKIGSYKIVKE